MDASEGCSGRFRTLLLIVIFCCGCSQYGDRPGNDLLKKKNIRIVVTDSGLGGLAVMDDIMHKVESSGYYTGAELIFVNALFDPESGYNSLPSRQEKVDMFNRVLQTIESKYSPDAIVVACNTLSVLLEENDYLKGLSTPVIGIVESGVDLIDNKLKEMKEATVLIFGTETTIEEGSHVKALQKRQIPDEKIIVQACPQLQSYIEQDPVGEETGMLIDYYVLEATQGLSKDAGPLLVSLNCTHFGYAGDLWKTAVENAGFQLGAILDPNTTLGDLLIINKKSKSKVAPKISLKVVSKVELRNVEPISYSFEDQSPSLAEAIRKYTLIPDLF
jgi:glutamate racemase